MAGKKKTKVVEPRTRDPRLDNAYLAEVEHDKALVAEWMREEGLNLTSASRRIGIARKTLEKIMSDSRDWSRRTIAPKRWTMHLIEQAAGIKTKKWRPKPKRRKRIEYYPLRQPKLPRRRR